MNNYQTIYFDWYGVLSNSDYWMQVPEYPVISELLTSDLYELTVQWTRGDCNSTSAIDVLSKKCGLSAEYLRTTLIESCELFTFAEPGFPEMITQLRSGGVRCFVTTDNYDAFEEWVVPALRLNRLFDGVRNSHTLKTVKWDVRHGESPFFRQEDGRRALWLDDNNYLEKAQEIGIDFELVSKSNTATKATQQLLEGADL